jgi:hypothetical protein
LVLKFGFWGVGFKVWGLGFWVWGLDLRVCVKGLGFRGWGLGFWVESLGIRVWLQGCTILDAAYLFQSVLHTLPVPVGREESGPLSLLLLIYYSQA